MKIRWVLLIVVATVVLAGSVPPAIAAVAPNSWDDATNFETKERFIPVELWAGAEWNGRRELEMPKVDGNYRHNKSAYSIKGPTEWKHPATGHTHTVYERINPQSGGPKWQIFVINEERTGLGRLYDGRPNRDTRTSSCGLKFPLGLWKEGETKKFEYKVYEGSRDSASVESIKIKQIDFVMGSDKHCLEFYWTVTDRTEKKLYDHHTYVYCPGKSMVHEIQH
jgi:hypothetical protein